MIRHLIPRISWSSWSGPALPDEPYPHRHEVRGGIVAFQWLGFMVEIAGGPVRAVARWRP